MAFIRQISIQGFKSFGGRKVVLNLDKGLIAIVGENGSGKSNILDAVCFVMGRLSSKALRAESFASLLFNGGAGHPPAKFCRATLVFDNTDRQFPIDADEVVVSREVDTSGVSTYRIGGSRCTRTELLDTIGVAGLHPEGYNIVLQNELANIVAMSAPEIRQIVERVAGISVFDEKKRQIESELEKVDGNLKIVQMRTEEIRQEYSRLEKDRSDALHWQEITARLTDLQRDLTFAELARIEERLTEMKAEYGAFTQNINDFKTQRNQSKTRSADLTESAKADSARIKELRQKLHEKEIEATRLREKLKGLELSAEAISQQVESLSTSIEHVGTLEEDEKNRYSQLKELISGFKSENASLQEKISPIRERLSKISEQASPSDTEYLGLRKQIDDLTDAIEQKRSELGEIVALHRVTEKRVTDLNCQIEDSVSLLPDQESEVEAARVHHSSLKASLDQTRLDYTNLEKQQQKIQSAIIEREQEQTELVQLIQKSKEELLEVQTRLKTIKELKRYGLSRKVAIKEVLRFAKDNDIPGVYGTISTLGKTSTKYAVALEVAGGSRLDFIVVEDEDTAAKCIDYLKGKRVGRATFIPLKSIKSKSSLFKGKQSGVFGNAIELLSFDEKYRPAFEFVFGHTIIVKNLDIARNIDAPGFRKITIDGDVVEPHRIMTGGYFKPLTSITLEEETRIPELQKKLKELRDLQVKRNKEFQKSKKDLEEVREEIDAARQKMVTLEREVIKAADTMEEKEEALATYKTSIDVLNKDLEEEETSRSELEAKQKREQSEMEQLIGKRQELQEKLGEIERTGIDPSLNRLREQLDQLMQEHRDVQLQLTEKTSEMRHASTEQKRLHKDLKNSTTELESRREELEKTNKEITASKGNLTSLEKEILEMEQEIRVLDKQLEAYEEEKHQLADLVDVLFEKISEEQMSRSKLEGRIELWEDRYNTQKEKISGMEPPPIPVEASMVHSLRRQCTTLEQEREALGLINQKAVERFEEVSQAYDEILEKERHIHQERDAILDALKRAEEEKFKVFMTAFTSISNNFSEIYQKLTSGEGYLELENPENPFLGGILMKVRPIGKRIQYLDALSGGEKALTAITFILALQLHQPAPFYFLDEIDETLDANNADRVAQLLENLSRDSQFIIVSHNEITIRRANTLFGVTMAEGISRVFSVKFEEGILLIEGKS
ncbi:MAG: chromosome segregation protein SMC [Promethearchaeota archaeon]